MSTVKTLSQKRTSQRNKVFQNTTEFKAVRFYRKTTKSPELIQFELSNGSTVIFPVKAFPKLAKASRSQKLNYELTPYFIFWDDVDEIVGIKNLFDGSIAI